MNSKKLPAIVFFGSSEFSSAILRDLFEKGFPLSLVITQPDKPFGRKKSLRPPPVKLTCEELDLPFLQPRSLKRESLLERFRKLEFDFGVVCAYGKIIPLTLLQTARVNFINTHASNLPRFRGAAPMERAIMMGDLSTALCVMEVSEALDEGDVFCKEIIEISPQMHIDQLEKRMIAASRSMLTEVMQNYPQFEKNKESQGSEKILYAHKLSEMDSWINLEMEGREIYNKLRALCSSYGIVFCTSDGKKIAVFKGSFEEVRHEQIPGTVMLRTKKDLNIAVKGGVLQISEIQIEGKKRLPIAAYLAGSRVELGDSFLFSMRGRS